MKESQIFNARASNTLHEEYSIKKDYLLLDLKKEDLLELCNLEGDQATEICFFNTKGENASELIDGLTSFKVTSSSINNILQSNDYQADELKKIALTCKVDKKNLELHQIYSTKGKAGEKLTFKVNDTVKCLVFALGRNMLVNEQQPATPILAKIRRSLIDGTQFKTKLPKPLASNPLQDIRIDRATAQSYKVKKGQYIQIIDVEGHQCSDFQCFAESDLNNGDELGIDPTVTRSIVGSSYPEPGVHNKYYNLNSEPLVEVIQDMVNRHDTFGLACNRKYYEDVGYPGHANCTDNFNSTLAQYGFKPRKNWISLNLFFNTNVKECNTIATDVSWSRPGDYILFRALTDLVCVSSACPDDTTAANDWNPTDIHLRVYDEYSNLSNALAFRPTPQTLPIMTRETGFHKNTKKLTRNFIDYNGFWLASDYTEYGTIKEYWACRESVVMMDLSPLRKFEIYGEDAEELMQYALPKDIRKLAVGQIVYTGICYENGGMLDDGTLFRLDCNNFRWICGSDLSGEWLRKLAVDKNLKEVFVKSSTDELHNVSVQGPKSRDVLRQLLWTTKTQPTIDELGWFRFSIGRLYEENGTPIILSRTGYTGELGFEVFCHPKDSEYVWNEIWKAGEEFNIAPLGLDALDLLRVEAGLIFAGYEFCDQTDPFEAGIGFSVPLKTKEDDFIGKDALIKRKANPQKILVGLELDSNEVAEHGDGVYVARQQVGIITSAIRSPILKKNIALCRLSTQYSELGSQVEVGKLDGHQKRIKAQVVSFPFYDPEKKRVRS